MQIHNYAGIFWGHVGSTDSKIQGVLKQIKVGTTKSQRLAARCAMAPSRAAFLQISASHLFVECWFTDPTSKMVLMGLVGQFPGDGNSLRKSCKSVGMLVTEGQRTEFSEADIPLAIRVDYPWITHFVDLMQQMEAPWLRPLAQTLPFPSLMHTEPTFSLNYLLGVQIFFPSQSPIQTPAQLMGTRGTPLDVTFSTCRLLFFCHQVTPDIW